VRVRLGVISGMAGVGAAAGPASSAGVITTSLELEGERSCCRRAIVAGGHLAEAGGPQRSSAGR